jgi:hypothetical protein
MGTERREGEENRNKQYFFAWCYSLLFCGPSIVNREPIEKPTQPIESQ